MRRESTLSIVLVTLLAFNSGAQAQGFRDRFWQVSSRWEPPEHRLLLAQADSPSRPPQPQPEAPPPLPGEKPGDLPPQPKGRKPILVNFDVRYGFDSNRFFVNAPVPFEVTVKRRIRTAVLSGTYPVDPRTQISVNVPWVDQSTKNKASNGATFNQSGSGMGDVSLWVSRTFPDYRRGREYGISAGMVFPTGRDPFNLPANKLETGLGFYQPSVRFSARTTKAPLQFFSTFDYSTSLSRNVNGQSVRLPNSYGGEVGIFYTLGPIWSTQTSVSFAKATSPFLQDSGRTVGYLSQALNYNPGDGNSFRGAVDVGLNDSSTDAYFSLSLNRPF